MNSTLFYAVMTLVTFGTAMTLLYFYSDGKWNVPETKRESYEHWVSRNGNNMKRGIVVLSVLIFVLVVWKLIQEFT